MLIMILNVSYLIVTQASFSPKPVPLPIIIKVLMIFWCQISLVYLGFKPDHYVELDLCIDLSVGSLEAIGVLVTSKSCLSESISLGIFQRYLICWRACKLTLNDALVEVGRLFFNFSCMFVKAYCRVVICSS